METWSSWLAEVGRLVTLLGWARHWFSAARAAAVTWAIMKPEFTPLSAIRKAGRPDRKSTRLNSSHLVISYAVFCLKKNKSCVHGTLDFVGYPRFPARVELLPSVVTEYIHPVNIQTSFLYW